MKAFLLAASVALAVTSAAYAQQAAPSPEKLALARQIFEAQGGVKNLQAMVDSVQSSMMAQVLQSVPPDQRAAREAVQDAARETMRDFLPRLIDFETNFFAVNFSDAELKDIAGFYKSPTGQDIIAKGPLLAQQLGPFMAIQMPLIRRSVVDRYCDKTTCSPALRTAMLGGAPTAR
jgi:hypothetical protein